MHQSDLFLSETEARLKELRNKKHVLEKSIGMINAEIYDHIKKGTSYKVGAGAFICLLPSGGSYFYKTDPDLDNRAPRVQEFHAIDLEDMQIGVHNLLGLMNESEQRKRENG